MMPARSMKVRCKLHESGMLNYTRRAFAQDANLAMQGKIDRGLVELITNADDAYIDAEGEIHVSVNSGGDGFSFIVTVRDNAIGLDSEGLKTAFTSIGAVTAKLAEGGQSRGLLGRGAKDVAVFGKVGFQSIKDGKYSQLEISEAGSWSSGSQNIPATEELRKELGILGDENGLVAKIYVRNEKSVPRPFELAQTLQNTAQLRELLKRRHVVYFDERDLKVGGRLLPTLPIGDVVLDTKIELPSFPGEASLIVRRLSERQPGQVSATTAHGLLVIAGMTVFENTWFGLGSRPESGQLAGEVVVPQIIDVLREELANTESAQLGLVSRNRDGLSMSHPLSVELQRAVSLAVIPLMDQIAKESSTQENQGKALEQALKAAAASIRQDIKDFLRDLDEDLGGTVAAPEPGNLVIIPPRVSLRPGANGTFTIRAIDSLTSSKLTVTSLDDPTLIEGVTSTLGEQSAMTWADHPRLDRKVANWRYRVGEELGEQELTFSMGESSTTVRVTVEDRAPQVDKAPEELQFVSSKYSVSPGRARLLILRAPLEYSLESIQITSEGVPLESFPEWVTLEPAEDGAWAEATVRVQAAAAYGNVVVLATGLDEKSAETIVEVREAGASAGLDFEFRLDGDESAPDRWSMNDLSGQFECVIYANHPSFAGVFGKYSKDLAKFTFEDEPAARAVLAQVLATAFASYFVELESHKRPSMRWDVPSTLVRHRNLFNKLAGKLHKVLESSES